MFSLALELGVADPDDLMASLSAKKIEEWRQFFKVREDLHEEARHRREEERRWESR